MKKLAVCILFIASATTPHSHGQVAAAPVASPARAKKAEKRVAEKEKKPSATKSANPFATGLQSNEPTTTEIYADEAFFDSTKNMGIFSGRVKVTDPRFNLQSDKLTVFITKGQSQSLEKAIAEGNVGLVRDHPDPSGGPPTRAGGRTETCGYTLARRKREIWQC